MASVTTNTSNVLSVRVSTPWSGLGLIYRLSHCHEAIHTYGQQTASPLVYCLLKFYQCIEIIQNSPYFLSVSGLVLIGKHSIKKTFHWFQKTVVIIFLADGIAFTFLGVSLSFFYVLNNGEPPLIISYYSQQ